MTGGDPSPRQSRPERGEGQVSPRIATATVQPLGCTLAAYAEHKGLPEPFLKELGLSDISYQGSPALRIPYRDSGGTEPAVRFRTALVKSEAGDNRFRWKSGSKPLLYGLWRLRPEPSVVIVEGESDCHTLWHHGINAVGLPGAGTVEREPGRSSPRRLRDHLRPGRAGPGRGGDAALDRQVQPAGPHPPCAPRRLQGPERDASRRPGLVPRPVAGGSHRRRLLERGSGTPAEARSGKRPGLHAASWPRLPTS